MAAKITFRNTSELPLTTVARVSIPKGYPLPIRPCVLIDGANCPLLPEKGVGGMATIYSVKGKFPALSKNEYDIFEGPEGITDGQFVLSDWVAKDPIGSVFLAQVYLSNGQVVTLNLGGKIENISGNRNVLNFNIESSVVKGFKLKQILSVFDNLDHVQFKLGLNWHNRTDPNYSVQISKIVLNSKDEFVIHGQYEMGLPKPTYQPLVDNWRLEIVPSAVELRDGQGLELRGYILTMPDNFISTNESADRVNNLKAVKTANNFYGAVGEVEGVFHDLNWNQNWFNKHLPVEGSVQIWNQMILQPSVFGVRKLGISKTPGQTGHQEDFGADKGSIATVKHDPLYITQMKYAQCDRLRFFNVHEPNGGSVTRELHPGRKTWNMETFDNTSTDTLGKTKGAWRGLGTGWAGYDNQHRSQNNLLTYYALTGDELTLDTLLNCVEADIQQSPYLQADREVGRMFNCWAKMLKVLPSEYVTKLKTHIDSKIDNFLQNWRARFLQENNSGTQVKVSQVILDNRSGIVNPNTGLTEPSWIAYQVAQAIQGLYSMSLEYGGDRLNPIIRDLCHTLLWYGIFKEGTNWIPCMFVRYRTGLASGQMINEHQACPEEGVPLDPSAYSANNWQVSLDLSTWWWDWIAPAIAIAKLVCLDAPTKDRAQEILTWAYPNGITTAATAEWFATPL